MENGMRVDPGEPLGGYSRKPGGDSDMASVVPDLSWVSGDVLPGTEEGLVPSLRNLCRWAPGEGRSPLSLMQGQLCCVFMRPEPRHSLPALVFLK